MAKEGSTISGLMDSFATARQPGAAVRRAAEGAGRQVQPHALRAVRLHRNPDIPIAKSIMDYIFRYMATKFMSRDEQHQVGIIDRQLTLTEAMALGEGGAPAAPRRRRRSGVGGGVPTEATSSRQWSASAG